MSRRMTRSRAARTTALVASLSMAIPFPLYAQSGYAQSGEEEPCTDGSSPPCETREEQQGQQPQEPETQPATPPEEVPADPAPERQPVPDETPSEAPAEVPQPDQPPEIPADEGAGNPEGESLGDALNRALQQEPSAEPGPSAEQAQPSAAPPAEGQGAQEPAQDPAAEDARQESPADSSSAAAEEDALRRALEQQGTGSETAPAETQPAETQPAETRAGTGEAPAPEAGDDSAAGEAATGDSTTGDGTTGDSTTGDSAGAGQQDAGGAAADTADQGAALPAGDDTGEAPAEEAGRAAEDGQAASDEQPVPEQLMADQPDPASGEPPALDALAATGSEGGEEARDEVAVSEETVTEETARSSSEEFGNTVSEAASSTRDDDDDDNDDDRWNSALSDREKVMLLGLGALAVGAVISNNRRVELNSGDRVVVQQPDGSYQVLKDDGALLRQPGSNVRTEQFRDGSSRTTVLREDGSKIVTIYSPDMRVLRRTRIDPNGREYLLIDDTVSYEPVDVSKLPAPRNRFVELTDDEQALRAALARDPALGRSFSLSQIRNIAEVRALVPVIDVNAITFETGSAAITPDQAQALASLGRLIRRYIDENPQEVFLIEGHTDAVGSAASNLALSDRRAESVALALSEYFDVPPENMVVQGYGESYLRVDTQAGERANRRVAVRRITDLLQTAAN